jgi:hypothetical protein
MSSTALPVSSSMLSVPRLLKNCACKRKSQKVSIQHSKHTLKSH